MVVFQGQLKQMWLKTLQVSIQRVMCPQQFSAMCSCSHSHGEQMYGLPCGWVLTLSMYIVCHHLQGMDPCATCSHVVSLCMSWEKEPHMWVAFATALQHLSDQHLTLAIFNRQIMDLACFGKQRSKKHLCPQWLWFNCPPTHTEIICRWFDAVLNGHGIVFFKWGFVLQNPLITPVIFDNPLNHDLRLL